MKVKIYLGVVFLTLTFTACKKDRVTDPTYESMDEFYNEHKVEEQEFIIYEEDSTKAIIGNQGTELFVSKRLFKFSDRNDVVTFPYKIKLVELYQYDDVIFYQMPTPHSDGALDNGGEIRVRAFKDDEELILIPGLFYNAKFSSVANGNDKQAFHGTTVNDEFSSWNLATDGSSVAVIDNKYLVSTYKMGWLTPAKNNPGSGKTDVTFKVNGKGGELIDLALCFKNFHCVLLGNNLVVKDAPIGEEVTIIGMAKDSKGKFRLHQSTTTITAGLNIKLEMEEVDEATLLSQLDAL